MGLINGVLENTSAVVRQGANGPWTKHILTIGGRDYQAHSKVYNQAAGWVGHQIQADVTSKEKDNGFTDWYVNAVFPPEGTAATTATSGTTMQVSFPTATSGVPSRPPGTLTEAMRNASICRQVAGKLLVEAGVAPGSEVFWHEIGPIARYFATGESPKPAQAVTEPPEPKPGYVEQTEPFIPEDAKVDPYDETLADNDLPF